MTRNQKWIPMWAVPVLVILAIGTVWLRLTVVGTTYAIGHAGQELKKLRLAKEQEELKITGLKSPRRLETLAKGKFGLEQPRPEQVVHLK